MRHLASVALVITALLAVLPSRVAQADLLFPAGEPAHKARMAELLATLPAKGRSADVRVYEFAPDVWHLAEWLTPGILGLYGFDERPTPAIYVLGGSGWRDDVFVHEFGHHVEAFGLSAAERREWTRFWKAHLSEMPTLYAHTNAEEGFAEVYMTRFTGGELDDDVRAELERLLR